MSNDTELDSQLISLGVHDEKLIKMSSQEKKELLNNLKNENGGTGVFNSPLPEPLSDESSDISRPTELSPLKISVLETPQKYKITKSDRTRLGKGRPVLQMIGPGESTPNSPKGKTNNESSGTPDAKIVKTEKKTQSMQDLILDSIVSLQSDDMRYVPISAILRYVTVFGEGIDKDNLEKLVKQKLSQMLNDHLLKVRNLNAFALSEEGRIAVSSHL